jgi:hypothetical protein
MRTLQQEEREEAHRARSYLVRVLPERREDASSKGQAACREAIQDRFVSLPFPAFPNLSLPFQRLLEQPC